ncbi:MAG: hypothetical protein PHN88_09175 [Ignavibacteria bacterium]|nr:hypothetical protein [Ignavibacteria bacterium]
MELLKTNKDYFSENKPTIVDAEKRILKCLISAQTPDRIGDIVISKGVDYLNFEKTGANVLFNHNPDAIIAHSLWIRPETDGLLSSPKFDDDPLSSELFKKASERPFGWSVRIGMDRNDIQKTEDGFRQINKSELIEYSLTPIPMHPSCVTKSLIEECLKNSEHELLVDYYEKELRYYELKDEIELFKKSITDRDLKIKNLEDILGNPKTDNDLETKYKDLEKKNTELFDKIANMNNVLNIYKNKIDKIEFNKTFHQIHELVKTELGKYF